MGSVSRSEDGKNVIVTSLMFSLLCQTVKVED